MLFVLVNIYIIANFIVKFEETKIPDNIIISNFFYKLIIFYTKIITNVTHERYVKVF